ncbi:MAG: metallophosphoesterase family protein [Acidobacteriota bacterium]
MSARSSIILPLFLLVAGAQTPLHVTHGPMLGRLGSNHIGVWARTSAAGTFRVRYGLAPDKLDALSPAATTRVERDHTGWVLIEGLQPDTKYYYQVVPAGPISRAKAVPDGSFRTLPDAAQVREPRHNPRGLFNFSFEFACGNNQNPGSGLGPALPGFKTMLARLKDKIHFAILNGDWLYEEARDYPAAEWLKRVGLARSQTPRLVQLAPTIAGVWENYKLYLSRGKNLAAWHREIPSYFTMDDHEILNDVYGTGTPGRRDRLSVFRDIGSQAWWDYLGWSNAPEQSQEIHFGRAQLKTGSDVLADPEADFTRLDLEQAGNLHVHWGGPLAGVLPNEYDGKPSDPNAGVYEIVERLDRQRLRIRPAASADGNPSYSIGRFSYYQMRVSNAHFFCLDTRTNREMHDVRAPAKPGLTMLGRRQRAWLMEGMKRSDAAVFFVVSSVNFMIPHVGGTPSARGGGQRLSNKDDAWTAFLDEREQLIRFWDSLGKPVFVLTGDIHNSFAIKITGRVWEFASGPHNSRNHTMHSEGDRPANGVFDSRGRKCDIRWSSYFLDDVPGALARQPVYTVVQVNNVFNNALAEGKPRWVAFPHPQVVVQYYDGFTGNLLYAESILAE